MSKRAERTPLWKVVLLAAGGPVVGAALIITGAIIRHAPTAATAKEDPAAAAANNMAGLMLLVGLIAVAGGLIGIGWLIYRYYLTIPAWKRRKGPPPRR